MWRRVFALVISVFITRKMIGALNINEVELVNDGAIIKTLSYKGSRSLNHTPNLATLRHLHL